MSDKHKSNVKVYEEGNNGLVLVGTRKVKTDSSGKECVTVRGKCKRFDWQTYSTVTI
jgi:hypothetical protein